MKKVKVVAISDTHLKGFPDLIGVSGDLLIHAGDGLNSGSLQDWFRFKQQLKQVRDSFSSIVYVAGNHDIYVEQNLELCREELKNELNIIMLYNEMQVVEGLKIWGSPFVTQFYDWAFMRKEEDLAKIWEGIPENLDILITHGPPQYVLDEVVRGDHVGSPTLARKIWRLKAPPQVHVFGHIHAHGSSELGCPKNKQVYIRITPTHTTQFYNVSIMSEYYSPDYDPTVFEIEPNDLA